MGREAPWRELDRWQPALVLLDLRHHRREEEEQMKRYRTAHKPISLIAVAVVVLVLGSCATGPRGLVGYDISTLPLLTDADSRAMTMENPTGAKGVGGQPRGGRKGSPCRRDLGPGEEHVLAEYQWHITDPVRFQKIEKLTIQQMKWHEGLKESVQNVCSTAYWYQKEPHDPFPPLPGVQERLADFPTMELVGE